jgi:hypothetical protein
VLFFEDLALFMPAFDVSSEASFVEPHLQLLFLGSELQLSSIETLLSIACAERAQKVLWIR